MNTARFDAKRIHYVGRLVAVQEEGGRIVPVTACVIGVRSRGGLVMARLCLKPWEVRAVNRLRGQMALALATLERVATAAAPLLFGRL